MGQYLDKIEAYSSDVNVPLENTSYPHEIDAYWARLRSAADILKQAEDYKAEVKEKHADIYRYNNGKIAKLLSEAQVALQQTIEDEAFDKTKLKENVVNMDNAIRECRRLVTEFIDNKEKKEREATAREQEATAKREEEKRKLDEETRARKDLEDIVAKQNEKVAAKEKEAAEKEKARKEAASAAEKKDTDATAADEDDEPAAREGAEEAETQEDEETTP